MRTDTEPWWRQAEADLETVEWDFSGGRWYAASWCAQQAAEKALKALTLEQTGQDPIRTHDVRLRGSMVGAPPAVQHDLIVIFPIFSLTRYPDSMRVSPVDAVSDADAQQHLDAARRVLQWIQPQL